VTGAKSVGLVEIMMPGSSIGRVRLWMLAKSYMTSGMPAMLDNRTKSRPTAGISSMISDRTIPADTFKKD